MIIGILIPIKEQLVIHIDWVIIQLCLLFIFSFVLICLSWFGFYSFSRAHMEMHFECKNELENECQQTTKLDTISVNGDAVCWLPKSK